MLHQPKTSEKKAFLPQNMSARFQQTHFHFQKLHNVTIDDMPSPACVSAHAAQIKQIKHARGNIAPTQKQGKTSIINAIEMETRAKFTHIIISSMNFTKHHHSHTR